MRAQVALNKNPGTFPGLCLSLSENSYALKFRIFFLRLPSRPNPKRPVANNESAPGRVVINRASLLAVLSQVPVPLVHDPVLPSSKNPMSTAPKGNLVLVQLGVVPEPLNVIPENTIS